MKLKFDNDLHIHSKISLCSNAAVSSFEYKNGFIFSD